MNTFQTIDTLNRIIYEQYPDTLDKFWMGCSFMEVADENEVKFELVQSTDTCDGCPYINMCIIKRKTPVWFFVSEVGEQIQLLKFQMEQMHGKKIFER